MSPARMYSTHFSTACFEIGLREVRAIGDLRLAGDANIGRRQTGVGLCQPLDQSHRRAAGVGIGGLQVIGQLSSRAIATTTFVLLTWSNTTMWS